MITRPVRAGQPPIHGAFTNHRVWLHGGNTDAGLARFLVVGGFPARAFRLAPEDEAALVLSEWMGWKLDGAWIGRDGFDYLAALRRVRAPWLAIAGSAVPLS